MEHCCDRFGYKAFLNPLAARSNMVVSFADQALSIFLLLILYVKLLKKSKYTIKSTRSCQTIKKP